MWRNDVKDFMNGKILDVDIQKIKIDVQVKNSKSLEVELKKPYLIFGVTFVVVPESLKELDGKTAKIPLSNEEVPIIALKVDAPRACVPAHVEEDFKIAIEKNLPIKQVIMPVNASLDDNKPRDDKEWVKRNNVVLIVKHWSEEKYLYIEYKKQDWKCFISGGVDDGEDFMDAAIRELREESGYINIKTIEEINMKMANVFYAAHKGVNRYSTVTSFYIELRDGEQISISDAERCEHVVKWETKDNLYEILKKGFTDQIWLLKQHFHEIGAYTGMGKLINSNFLNDLEDLDEASKIVIDHLNGAME